LAFCGLPGHDSDIVENDVIFVISLKSRIADRCCHRESQKSFCALLGSLLVNVSYTVAMQSNLC